MSVDRKPDPPPECDPSLPLFSYSAEGRPVHGPYCPTADYACVCGLFDAMYALASAIEEGLMALCGGMK